ncbi:MAG TPA: nitroreductase/quinone reductase family protein [Acidimicrobiia bacterium]
MPMPLWWAQINKRLFNPLAINSGKWDVITHVGRISGEMHRTPLAASEVDGTFIFIVVYGSKSDWVQNILASGRATLDTGEEVVDLVEPRLIPGETARAMIGDQVTLPPSFLKVNEYLQMDIAARRSAHQAASPGTTHRSR